MHISKIPKVTVGAPTYNRAQYIGNYLENILSQTFQDFEIVVCDDCSSDSTEDVVKGFDDARIRYYRNPKNLNIPGNLNRILELARGEMIVILHDHDIFDQQLLEKMVDFLEQNQTVGFVHTGTAWIDPGGSNYVDVSPAYNPVTCGAELLDSVLLGEDFSLPINACGMVRRSAYEEVGFRYDSQFGFLADVDLWLRLAAKFDVGYIRSPLITCRRRDDEHEYSGVNWKLVIWNIDIQRENIDRVYQCDVHKHKLASDKWQKRKARYCTQSLLAAAAHGDHKAFADGLEYMKLERIQYWSRLAHFFEGRKYLQNIAVALMYRLNKIRKRVF
jgi:glycosyltransferase involved in cell wall biosynthesis